MQDKQKITPASHGDELDVLEAMYRLDKSKEKKLLSAKQLNTLISSGRIKDLDKSNTQEKKDNQSTNGKTLATLYVSSVLKVVEGFLIEEMGYCSRSEWDEKSHIAKEAILKMAFYVYFQIKLEDFMEEMEVVMGGNHGK